MEKPFKENHCKKIKRIKKYRLDAGVMNNDNIFITACKKRWQARQYFGHPVEHRKNLNTKAGAK
jgi:hypothetical protein